MATINDLVPDVRVWVDLERFQKATASGFGSTYRHRNT